jgi:HK97 family phage prohead protease
MSEKQKEAVARAMKGLRFKVKSADEGTVEAVFARFSVKDLDGDVTLPGAFENGAEVLISAYNHATWGSALPVGNGVIRVDAEKAWLEGQFWMDMPSAVETFLAVKHAGELQEWSYGYNVLETGEVTDEMYQNGVWRVLKKLKVFEVSPVMVGAGIGTQTVSLKSADLLTATAPAFSVGARVVALVDHMTGMVGMAGAIAAANAGSPPYYSVDFDEPLGDANPHKWLAENELEAEAEPADDMPMKRGDSASSVESKARGEFARFAKTRARLVGSHAA